MDGYGQFGRGPERLAHRIAWTLCRGPIPPGMRVLHHCDFPACCNPFGDLHLFVGTQADNVADMMAKGRGGHGPGRPVGIPGMKGEAHPMAKLTAEQVAAIRSTHRRGMGSALASAYGVSPATISMIVNRKTWAP